MFDIKILHWAAGQKKSFDSIFCCWFGWLVEGGSGGGGECDACKDEICLLTEYSRKKGNFVSKRLTKKMNEQRPTNQPRKGKKTVL